MHGRERVGVWYERGVDAGRDAVDPVGIAQALADREQLDDVAGLARGDHLVEGDARDALAVHRLDRHERVEGEAREDAGLLRGVVALDVGGRVGLGVAELARDRERLLERLAARVHAVEDEVRRAIDDAEDALDAVARERVAQRPDDRDRPADGGLVVELRADLAGRLEQLGAVRGHERLVRRHDVRARGERLEDERTGRLETAHELDDDVGAEDERLGIGREQLARQLDVARSIHVAHRDARELDAGADAGRQLVGVGQQLVGDLGADAAGPQEGDAEIAVLDHGVVVLSGSTKSFSS